MEEKHLLRREEGSVLVVAVVVLVLLTIIGISASTTSNIEVQIAGNERIYKQNLYKAEAAAMESAYLLKEKDLKTNAPTWLKALDGVDESTELPDRDYRTENSLEAKVSDTNTQDAGFLAVSRGIAAGSSLDMKKSSIHDYAVYGWGDDGNGLVIVKVGYRKAF